MSELATPSTRPEPVDVVAAWLTLPDGSVQLQRRPMDANHDAGKLALFGGRVDEGETSRRALLRELDEELCIPELELVNLSCRSIKKFHFDHSQTGRSDMSVEAYSVPIQRPLVVRDSTLDGISELYTPEQQLQLDPRRVAMTLGLRAVLSHLRQTDTYPAYGRFLLTQTASNT